MDNNNTFMEPKPQYGKRMRMMMSPQGELDSKLCQACYDGDLEEVEKLLDKGASAKACHDGGWTALHVAAYYNKPTIVGVLLDNPRLDIRSAAEVRHSLPL